eukprot:TRINITY_DN21932_c0_g1_i2.p2 TRINITY_DN21932_c0_g1~~TRINITY_DN21932_c0_g1_i2.p2  ORF type:complete len:329 (-),score=12.35 TRINITY_DN21932_c0_g1_i2:150-1040(-)
MTGIKLHERSLLPRRWCWFSVVSLLDVESNYLMIKAYQYSTITSVNLLATFTVPCVMALSYFFLGTRYSKQQMIGGLLAMLGVILLLVFDRFSDDNDVQHWQKYSFLGDLFVLLASLLYAVSNVLQERLLQEICVLDSLMLVGSFGVFWAGIQVSVFERMQMYRVLSSLSNIMLTIVFSTALFLFYCLAPWVMIWGGSTLFNLSLLSCQIWVAFVQVIFFGGFNKWSGVMFGGSFVLVVSGIVIFSIYGSRELPDVSDDFQESSEIKEKLLDEESQQSSQMSELDVMSTLYQHYKE